VDKGEKGKIIISIIVREVFEEVPGTRKGLWEEETGTDGY